MTRTRVAYEAVTARKGALGLAPVGGGADTGHTTKDRGGVLWLMLDDRGLQAVREYLSRQRLCPPINRGN